MGRKVRKTAIGLPNFVKVNSHLKIAILYLNFIFLFDFRAAVLTSREKI
jgi:hypothetical protein